ncbi:hypothetical protein E2P86_07900 [Sphingobacterium psychroaquaticum]|uniref:hypothetical protein n=1 Tax=Sphingobacterium psychroaquaticum TaxID=561061 RepID=UPI00106D52BF|nr:hypothetical protein [Sphingobacterium psychroaquaticum]QBQ41079.1 hypothetical protein E2P86_07900 [Sphingobacterium psychroaquaticum]
MASKGAVFNSVSSDLEKYRKDTVKKIKDLVGVVVSELLHKAQRGLDAASYDRENMSRANMDSMNAIHLASKVTKGGLKGEVGVFGGSVDDPVVMIAAYIEFGTGLSAKDILANYAEDIKAIARLYFKTGDGTLQGSPYLYNNYQAAIPQFEKDLKAILDKVTKS